MPFVGPILFGQDPLVYVSLALVAAVWWFLFRTRGGLILRAVGDNHASAHALGYRVGWVRFLRRPVRRRLRRARRRLSLARLYAAMGRQHDRRPRLDRAGAGGVRHLAAVRGCCSAPSLRRGHHPPAAFQAFAAPCRWLALPAQFLSALPYLTTIIVLVIISRTQGAARAIRRPGSAAFRAGPLIRRARTSAAARPASRQVANRGREAENREKRMMKTTHGTGGGARRSRSALRARRSAAGQAEGRLRLCRPGQRRRLEHQHDGGRRRSRRRSATRSRPPSSRTSPKGRTPSAPSRRLAAPATS